MTNDMLARAVRDGIARTIAVVALAGVALIHLLDLPGKFSETPYLAWMYIALVALACTMLTGLRSVSPRRLALVEAVRA